MQLMRILITDFVRYVLSKTDAQGLYANFKNIDSKYNIVCCDVGFAVHNFR